MFRWSSRALPAAQAPQGGSHEHLNECIFRLVASIASSIASSYTDLAANTDADTFVPLAHPEKL